MPRSALRHLSFSLCSSIHHFTAPESSAWVDPPQPHCTRTNEPIIHTLSVQFRGYLAGAPRRRTPATNHRPTQRGPGLAPGATWPQRLRRRTPTANHRHARLTPPKVRPRRRRHVAAAAGNTANPPAPLSSGRWQHYAFMQVVALSVFVSLSVDALLLCFGRYC